MRNVRPISPPPPPQREICHCRANLNGFDRQTDRQTDSLRISMIRPSGFPPPSSRHRFGLVVRNGRRAAGLSGLTGRSSSAAAAAASKKKKSVHFSHGRNVSRADFKLWENVPQPLPPVLPFRITSIFEAAVAKCSAVLV